jgi:hypothetical protein
MQIAESNNPVNDGVLGYWNTSGLPPCAYMLRLVVWDHAMVECNEAYYNRAEYTVAVNLGCPADLNHDGMVGSDDLLALILGWGDCLAQPAFAEQLNEILERMDQPARKPASTIRRD